jgi:uncharacterized protein (TIRG00374 family)
VSGVSSESDVREATSRRKLVVRSLAVLIAGVSLYVVGPGLIAAFGSVPELADVFPAWFALVFLLEVLAFVCIWELLRIALGTRSWFDVACSQLAGNALSRVLPGGAATGGALQYQMLTKAGFDPALTTTALTATGLLSTASLFVLPIVALPPIFFGLAINSQLVSGAILAGLLAVVLLGGASIFLTSDTVVRGAGRLLDWLVRRFRGPQPEPRRFATRLVESRNYVRQALAEQWKRAVPAAFGNQIFDFLALEASLLAVGENVNVVAVLLAYVAAAALAMIPITPGGLGFVEAGLTGVLTLAGVSPASAALATLLYRLFQYWLTLPAGLVASAMFNRRHRERASAK